MKQKKRHLVIIELLSQKPFMTIEDLCRELNVSPATVRRDLTELQESEAIIRINGGAILKDENDTTQHESDRHDPYLDEKKKIAEAACSHVQDGDTIFMDAGSTNLIIAERLTAFSNITIITNSIDIVYKFINRKDITVIICGGTLGEDDPDSIVGPVAEKMIAMFRATIFFLGTAGIHIKQGITDRYLSSSRIKENMIENATKVCLVTDHSKFGVINTVFVCSLDKIHHVITDNAAPDEDIRLLKSSGIEVTLV